MGFGWPTNPSGVTMRMRWTDQHGKTPHSTTGHAAFEFVGATLVVAHMAVEISVIRDADPLQEPLLAGG